MPEKKLDGKIAIITGASKGIGRGIAEKFSLYGAKLVLIGRSFELKSVAETIVANGGEAIAVTADVRNEQECQQAVNIALKYYGTVDIVVANAGVFNTQNFLEISKENRNHVWDVNVNGVWNIVNVAIPEMIRKKRGKIIIISSVTGNIVANPSRVAYATSKSALGGFTRALASEMAQYQINVNAICPGCIRTQMLEELTHGKTSEETEQIMSDMAENIPLGRLGTPGDVGELAAFLGSYESDYITGEQIVVDGGNLLSEN